MSTDSKPRPPWGRSAKQPNGSSFLPNDRREPMSSRITQGVPVDLLNDPDFDSDLERWTRRRAAAIGRRKRVAVINRKKSTAPATHDR